MEVGYVTTSQGFLVFLDGLPSVKINDLIISEEGIRGWVKALHETSAEVLILDDVNIKPGELFKKANQNLSLNVGQFLLGRAINPLGSAIDGKKLLLKSKNDNLYDLDSQALGIASREFITQQFITGISLVDTLIPLGKGQRELIIGDAHSGKTGFLIDLIDNQKGNNTVCVYASIGKPINQLRNLIDVLGASGALAYTVIVASTSTDPPPLIFLAPQAALSVAEYFQKLGKDVLVILDDMGNHAKIHREISLLSGRSPGRESYPGDIFYQQSHLMERGGNFKKEFGGGSITVLPVIELNLNDFTGFIPTNLMGMTDGHLLFKASLHNQGQKPAIDLSLSVSRVGRQTQNRVQNSLSQKIRQVLVQAEELETLAKFSSELTLETRTLLTQKAMVTQLINQESYNFLSLEVQTTLLSLVFTTFLQNKDAPFISKYKNKLIEVFLKDKVLSQLPKSISKYKTHEELIQALEQQKTYLQKLCP